MKKFAIAFLIVMICVLSFTISSQAEDGEAPAPALITRSFDISSVTASAEGKITQVPLFGYRSDMEEPFEFIADELMIPEDVVDFIYNETGPDNWNKNDGCYITTTGHTEVTAKASPAIIEKIGRILDILRPAKSSYGIRIALFEVPEENFVDISDKTFPSMQEAITGIKAAGGEKMFFAESRIKTNRTNLISKVTRTEYSKDFVAGVASFSVGYELVTDTFITGYSVVSKIIETENGARLYIKYNNCELESLEKIETPAGIIENPQLGMYVLNPTEIPVQTAETFSFSYSYGKKNFVLVFKLAD